jgi:L-ascorbate metabolism protein UlaG (beta-lactamase superfamily)
MKYAHMNPEDMVRAHIDLGQPFTVPSHYDVFKLTDEPRGEALVNLAKAKEFLSVGKMINILEPGQFWVVPVMGHFDESKVKYVLETFREEYGSDKQ